ncbi:MAG: hypothetical protein KF758_05465 [Anaerolineales bacterium]|nr:hypothetical protein [Anaerolineales bacterium]MBX3036344.1 hypothetical protein [Anaerolineales bacterium]
MANDLRNGDYASFYLNAVGLMIPGVTGLGMLSKADEAYDTLRFVNKNRTDLLLGYQDHLIKYRGKIPGYDIFDVDKWKTSKLVSKKTLDNPSWRAQILEAIPNARNINLIVDDGYMTNLIFSPYLTDKEIIETIYFKDARTHWELDRIIQMGYEDKLTLWDISRSNPSPFNEIYQSKWLDRWKELRDNWITN